MSSGVESLAKLCGKMFEKKLQIFLVVLFRSWYIKTSEKSKTNFSKVIDSLLTALSTTTVE